MNKRAWNKIGKVTFSLVLILSIFLMSTLLASDWPMFKRDLNNTGYTPDTLNLTNFGLRWRTGIFGTSSVVLSNDLAFVVGNTISIVNATNGSVLWNYESSSIGTPLVVNETFYLGDASDKFYAFNISNLSNVRNLWNYSISGGGIESSPVMTGDIIYFGGKDYNFYALNASNGSLIWNYSTLSNIDSSPAVSEGIVYFGSSDNQTYALNASNGSLIWNFTNLNMVDSSPAVSEGIVYFGSNGNEFFALNASTGVNIWNYTLNSGIFASPSIDASRVFISDLSGEIFCFNKTNGSLIWQTSLDTGSYSSPVINNEMVSIGDESGKIYLINASNGSTIWSYNTGERIQSIPSISNDFLYFQTGTGYTYAFSKDSCLDEDNDGFGSSLNSLSYCVHPNVFDCDDNNASVFPPTDNMYINSNTMLCNGTYYLNDSGATGVVIINASGVSLTGNNTIIFGNGTGNGIQASNFVNLTIKNLNIQNYSQGMGLTINSSLIQNNTLLYSTYGILLNKPAMYNRIENNNASLNQLGIVLSSVNSILLQGNNITSNYLSNNTGNALSAGIALAGNTGSSNISSTIIFNNTFVNDARCILLYSVSPGGNNNNTIYDNNCTSTISGIHIYSFSQNNLIYNNYFNSPQNNTIDDGTNNLFNTTKTLQTNIIGGAKIGGNYYSDYAETDTDADGIGNTNYEIKNSSGEVINYDYLPLTNSAIDTTAPNVTIISPTNHQNSSSSSILFNVTALDETQMDSCWYSLNSGLTNYTMFNMSTSWNATNTSISDGTYQVVFYCNDTSNNLNNTETATFNIDTIFPSFTHTITNQTAIYNTSLYYDINASDTHIESFAINDSRFKVDISTGVLENNSLLAVGNYELNLTINDTFGNLNATIFSVNVTQAPGIVYTSINGSRQNITISNGTEIPINASLLNGSGYILLYQNGSLINNGTSAIGNITNFTTTGALNITTLYAGDENYTSAFETWWVNVYACGNNLREFIEVCDRNDLNSQSCATKGFDTGTLRCSANCMTFDTSNCSTTTIINGGGGGGGKSCTPECDNKNCGSDGCGGVCGTCNGGEECLEGRCASIHLPCEGDWICQWTLCTETEEFSYPYGCMNFGCPYATKGKPEPKSCDNIKIPKNETCESNIQCGDWGTCEINYQFKDAITGTIISEGKQKRICVDLNECENTKYEEKPCMETTKIIIEKKDEQTNLYDMETNELIGIIKQNFGRVDILFGVEELKPESINCLDGVQNFDEEGIDCGGENCKECFNAKDYFNWIKVIVIISWMLFLGLLIENTRQNFEIISKSRLTRGRWQNKFLDFVEKNTSPIERKLEYKIKRLFKLKK